MASTISKTTKPGNVYEESQPRRTSRHTHKKSARGKPFKADGGVAEKIFWSSMRKLLLVVVGMGLMLLGAYLFSNKMWDLKQNRYKRAATENAAKFRTEDRSRGGVRVLDPSVGKLDWEKEYARSGTAADPEGFDTESVRKAAYWARMARTSLAEGSNELALERFRESLTIWPHQPQVWRELGELYLQVKDLPRAKVALQRAAESDPSNIAVLTGLGEVHLRERNIEKALELLEAAREIDPAYPRTYFLLGKCYVAQRDLDAAMEYLQRYLVYHPNDAQALREKAVIEAERSLYTQSLETLRLAITAEPEWAELYFQAAAACALMNRTDDTIRYLEKGEAFTSPRVAYDIYRRAAFNIIRQSDIGKLYEKELADRARRMIRQTVEGNQG